MCRERAIDYIKAFHLPPDEETYIIEREVNDMLVPGIARKYNVSVETVKNRRRAAFARIADAIAYEKEKAQG